MARNSEFYKGTRKRRDYTVVAVAIIVAVLAVLLVMFAAMQKYAVISKEGVTVELPMLRDENAVVDSTGKEVHVFERVDATIVFDPPDYSAVKQTSKGDVQPIRAIYVSVDELDRETLKGYAARLSTGNALVLEMKPRIGNLMFYSHNYQAQNYGTFISNGITADLPAVISELKESGVYLAAQISCLVDSALPSRNTMVALRNEYGAVYYDDIGMYMDPYNTEVRQYIIDIIGELYELGFDEVILADVFHPNMTDVQATLTYSAAMSTTPDPVTAISSFAISIADAFADREDKVLSIYTNSAVSLVKEDAAIGQNAPLFFKLYDRVYYNTDRYTYTYNLEDVERSITVGEVHDRFVPVVLNYLPDHPSEVSWVLIDTETENED